MGAGVGGVVSDMARMVSGIGWVGGAGWGWSGALQDKGDRRGLGVCLGVLCLSGVCSAGHCSLYVCSLGGMGLPLCALHGEVLSSRRCATTRSATCVVRSPSGQPRSIGG